MSGRGWSEVVAIDGTRLHGNASPDANVDYEQIAREVVRRRWRPMRRRMSSTATRGDELPPTLAPPRAAGRGGREPRANTAGGEETERRWFDADRIVARSQGGRVVAEAKRQLEQDRW